MSTNMVFQIAYLSNTTNVDIQVRKFRIVLNCTLFHILPFIIYQVLSFLPQRLVLSVHPNS